MIYTTIVPKGKLEKHLKETLKDGAKILKIEIFSNNDWEIRHDDGIPVCQICEGPVDDPGVDICDSCADEPHGRLLRHL